MTVVVAVDDEAGGEDEEEDKTTRWGNRTATAEYLLGHEADHLDATLSLVQLVA